MRLRRMPHTGYLVSSGGASPTRTAPHLLTMQKLRGRHMSDPAEAHTQSGPGPDNAAGLELLQHRPGKVLDIVRGSRGIPFHLEAFRHDDGAQFTAPRFNGRDSTAKMFIGTVA